MPALEGIQLLQEPVPLSLTAQSQALLAHVKLYKPAVLYIQRFISCICGKDRLINCFCSPVGTASHKNCSVNIFIYLIGQLACKEFLKGIFRLAGFAENRKPE